MPRDLEVDLVFGGGLNTRKAPADLSVAECAAGKNFGLALDDSRFFRRAAFDLAGTAPNGLPVRGFAQLVNSKDDSISTLVQAGGQVYQWDGMSTFTEIATVNPNSRLRGGAGHNWNLGTPVVIITDLSLVQNVLKYDGTTLSTIDHNLGGDFFARYCRVAGERALYANVNSGTATPHLLAASKIGDFENLSVSNEAGSGGIGADDPWFLPAPDLRYINGLTEAFGLVVFSTRRGHMYKLSGSNATNFVLQELWHNSGASGDEPITVIGNDFLFGRPGRLETLFATEKLGDVSVDDLTLPISNEVESLDEWNLYYISRFQKIYAFSPSHSTVYVLHKDFIDKNITRIAERSEVSSVSPWSIHQTEHPMAFQPEGAMVMRDPRDGLENLFLGGATGEVFRYEGSGGQDGGTTDITVDRRSKLFRLPGDSTAFDIKGAVFYRKTGAGTLTITFEYAGVNIFDQEITLTIDSPANFPVWNGAFYWSAADTFWNIPFELRNARQVANPAGRFSEFQIKLSFSGAVEFFIERLFIKFTAK